MPTGLTSPSPQCETCGWFFVNGRCKRCEANILAPAWSSPPAPQPAVEIPAPIPALAAKPEIGSLVPQAHGGALRWGGTNPGAGRPKSLVKQRAIAHSEQSVEFLRQVRDAEAIDYLQNDYGLNVPCKPRMGDRIKATEALNKIAGLYAESDEDGETKPTFTVRVVYE